MNENTTPKYRWIMYIGQNAFGPSFDLQRVTGIGAARAAFEEYCRAVYTDECAATLYAYSEEDWASAVEFKDSGCPFDYPDKVIERGPRGGIRVENA